MKWFSIFLKKKTTYSYYGELDLEWDAFMFCARGKKHFFKSEFDEALELFDKAIEKGYEKKDIFEFRGMCLQSLGYEFDAIEDFNKAIIIAPNNHHIHYNRALSKETIFDYKGAVEDIEKAIELAKKDTPINKPHSENAIIRMYKTTLIVAKSKLEFEISEKERLQKEKVKHIKRR
jgi:tetratricopeptide (TPR) repeat protein